MSGGAKGIGEAGLLAGYAHAKLWIRQHYPDDLRWAEGLERVKPDAEYVVRETAWVILNSGFRFAVARKLWPAITDAFRGWSLEQIDESCVKRALKVLKHTGKIRAMYLVAIEVRERGPALIVADAADPKKLTRLPFIGKITCYHLAKVLGANVLKPDVHLERAAQAAGFRSAWELGAALKVTGDRLPVIDSVLWRWGEQQRRHGLRWEQLWGPLDGRG